MRTHSLAFRLFCCQPKLPMFVACLAAVIVFLSPVPVQAGLIIESNFIPANQQFPTGTLLQPGALGDAGLASLSPKTYPNPPPKLRNDVLNSLLIKDLKNAACWWMSAISDHQFTLKLSFGWQDLGGPPNFFMPEPLAVFDSTKRDANGRTIQGVIRFNNSGSIPWFLDDTPPVGKGNGFQGNEEFGNSTDQSLNLGSKNQINVARYRTAIVNGPADDKRFDLWSVALHEIGHALGVDASTPNYNNVKDLVGNIKILQDLPAGAGTKGATLAIAPPMPGADTGLHLNYQHAVMFPTLNAGERRFLSAADILAASEIDGFTNINLDPSVPCPEPSTLLLGLTGVLGILGYAWRRQSAL